MKTTRKQILLKHKKINDFITSKIDGCYELDELAEQLALKHHLEYVNKDNIENYADIERELLINNCLDNFLIHEKEQLVKDFILDRKKAINKWLGGENMENNKILLLKNLKEKINKYEKNADYLNWKNEYKSVETELFNEYTENIKIENPTYNFSVNYSQTSKLDLNKLRDYCNQNNIEIEQFYITTNTKKITMTLKGK